MKIATLKAQATNMRLALEKTGVVLTHGQSLEAIAGQYGFDTWDALCGVMKKAKELAARVPTLADLPGVPESITVERDSWSASYEVLVFDLESIVLMHDEKKLLAHFAKNPGFYFNELDTPVIVVSGDGKYWQFTLRQLQGIKYEELGGKGYWHLEDIEGEDLYLSFSFGDVWTPSKAEEGVLRVPEMVKSAKGCEIVVMPSLDGDRSLWRYLIVPPHLNAKEIANKMVAEVRRLKALEASLTEDERDEKESTELDVKAYAQSLGCTWAEWVSVASNAYD